MQTSFNRCKAHRRRILELSQRGPSHVASAFSCLEIVDLIYYELKRPEDIFIMSKGHGCLAQYVVLESMGLMKADDPKLGGHPDYGDHIEASTGSLGHGLGMAVGMAYAEYLKGSDKRVYVLMSDGELQEGSTWEAVRMASQLKLDNLIVFVDANGFGGMEPIDVHGGIFKPTVWEIAETDGHSAELLHHHLRYRLGDRPLVLICRTVKGKGASFMVGQPIWHYKSPNAKELEQAMAENA